MDNQGNQYKLSDEDAIKLGLVDEEGNDICESYAEDEIAACHNPKLQSNYWLVDELGNVSWEPGW